ncbi:hypothetical protein sr15689 [Sporisorium reilianum SRZ2]|uniref:Uncharacterized protein n=1 Tax=Sporisorium reilianum (strain SRZ2) TaxID=999809 RepID=E6ZRB4_SPORE|nr:hypothetical protein sr15689 [Sporisorium reilianum SRZ2]
MDDLSLADMGIVIERLRLLDPESRSCLDNNRALLNVFIDAILQRGSAASSASNTVTTSRAVSAVSEADSGQSTDATAPTGSARSTASTGSSASTGSTAFTDDATMPSASTASPADAEAGSAAVAPSATEMNDLVDVFAPTILPVAAAAADLDAVTGAPHREPRAILLPGTNLSSVDFCHPAKFRIVGGTDEEPSPLNMIVKITRNHFNNKIGRTNFRIVMVDIGDGKERKMTVNNGSDFYDLDRHSNPFPSGTIVVLRRVQGKAGYGRKSLVYTVHSSMSKLRTPIEWQDVQRWHQDISDQSRA